MLNFVLEVYTLKKLWYDHPAENWNHALPLGNGRLGAMVFGGIKREKLQLNEDSVWSGGPRDRTNPVAVKTIEKIRRLIRSGEISEAQRLARLALNGTPCNQRVYQTAGDLVIDFDRFGGLDSYQQILGLAPETTYTIDNYKCELDIEDAVHNVFFESDGVEYKRTTFISAPDNVAVMRLSASEKGALNFTVKLERGISLDNQFTVSDDTIAIEITQGIPYCVMAKAVAVGGEITCYGGVMRVTNADEVLIFANVETSFRHDDYKSECIKVLENASKKTFYELFHAHADDYKSYFGRLSLSLGGDDLSNVPTDVRLNGFARGNEDNGLVELYYQFGRYLMISSSRPGTLPTTLQGIWNEHLDPPWGCKYTVNINTEMNYWPSNMCNLHELHMPLFEHLKRMLPNGRKVAKDMYGCGGFVCHHNTDIWGDCAPQDDWLPATHWVLGAAWLCTHIWEHYEYTADISFLAEYYPIMRESAQFFIEYLREDDKGRLVVIPSVSPENTYRHPSGDTGCLCEGCTMDNQILRHLFVGCIGAEKALGIDDGITDALNAILEKLPKTTVHSNGTIMEWNDEFEEIEVGHRHVSHLYGLYPSSEINVLYTPELAKAARATLDRRLSHGGGHTGWSMAWIINLWARLHDAEKAYEGVRTLLKNSTLPNLFDNHPPFQIDGNFGSIAGITQMIIQSIGDDILLLPALPDAWSDGSLKGVCLRKGITANITWQAGIVTSLTLCCTAECTVNLHNGGKIVQLNLNAGEHKII